MSRTSLLDVRSLKDPLLTYNWDVIIPILPGTSDSRPMTYKAMSATIPGRTLEQVAVNLGAVEVRYAGRENNSHSWAVTFHETRDVGTRQALLRWQAIARNNRLNSGTYKSIYSATVQLVLYDDIPSEVRRIVMLGVWPETVDESSLDRASGAVSTSVTFSYDDFEDIEV